jgi:hypothetical protein
MTTMPRNNRKNGHSNIQLMRISEMITDRGLPMNLEHYQVTCIKRKPAKNDQSGREEPPWEEFPSHVEMMDEDTLDFLDECFKHLGFGS